MHKSSVACIASQNHISHGLGTLFPPMRHFSCHLVSVLTLQHGLAECHTTNVLLFVLCCIVVLVCLACVMFMKYVNEEHDTKGCIHFGFAVN